MQSRNSSVSSGEHSSMSDAVCVIKLPWDCMQDKSFKIPVVPRYSAVMPASSFTLRGIFLRCAPVDTSVVAGARQLPYLSLLGLLRAGCMVTEEENTVSNNRMIGKRLNMFIVVFLFYLYGVNGFNRIPKHILTIFLVEFIV